MLKALSAQLAALLDAVLDLLRAVRHHLWTLLERVLELIRDAIADILPTIGTLIVFNLLYLVSLALIFFGQLWLGVGFFALMTSFLLAANAKSSNTAAPHSGIATLALLLSVVVGLHFLAWHFQLSHLRETSSAKSDSEESRNIGNTSGSGRLRPGNGNDLTQLPRTPEALPSLSFSITAMANGERINPSQALAGGDQQIRRLELVIDYNAAIRDQTTFTVDWLRNGELYSSTRVKADQTDGRLISGYDNAVVPGTYSIKVLGTGTSGAAVERTFSFTVNGT